MTPEEKQYEYHAADWLQDAALWRVTAWRAPHFSWDHDHCFFCYAARFADPDHCPDCARSFSTPGSCLRQGWRYDYPDDPGNYEMICDECFAELRDTFRWKVLDGPGQPGQ
jgi:hypothetical protein